MAAGIRYLYRAPADFLQQKHRLIVFCEHRSNTDQLLAFITGIQPCCDGIIIVDSSNNDNLALSNMPVASKLMLYIRSTSTCTQNIFLDALSENHISAVWGLLLHSNEIPIPVSPVWSMDSINALQSDSVIFAVTFTRTFDQGSYYFVVDDSNSGFSHEARLFRLAHCKSEIVFPIKGSLEYPLSGLVFCRSINPSTQSDLDIDLFTPVRPLSEIYRSGNKFMNFVDWPEHDLGSAVKNSVNRIADYYLTNNSDIENFGLYTGTTGIALFMAQLYLYTKNERYSLKLNAFLDKTLEYITTHEELCPTFCDGLAGFGWLISYLTQKDLIDTEQSCFDLLDATLRMHMKNLVRYDMFDVMHGMLSIARYFIRRHSIPDLQYSLRHIQKKMEKGADGELLWPVHSRYKAPNYDFGLAHGTAGILYFLDQCYHLNIEPELSCQLGDGLVRFYLLNEQPIDQAGSFYPYSVYCDVYHKKQNIRPITSRLAWCYGDLSALFIIYRHAILTKNTAWQKIFLDKLIATTSRQNLEQVNICDAQFCHGTAGLIHMYNKLFHQTGCVEFRNAAIYWIKVTLQMQTPESDTGYFFRISTENSNPVASDSLLEGSVGVGLALLSIFDKQNTDWDEAMMLS
ncbi:MAG: lanthionine synthetase C family protein [Rikenella sp.]|nr:lanthionine synthetase C family protein [Rikenella sp.]